ncbi:MAG: nitronate monooxygenase [Bacteroidetes bacterium HGW-Bacteroidetes-5]|jgi:enoyl-[acyl-carrier protein] reductase II|nr:MAG: nitronate monooxygenase [Bacteroidetes bacterium HGW-Bacteroidetes-5]
MENKICKLFGIKYPIIQAGMVWCSGWRLASAVSKAGGLGLIGAGSMHPDNLRHHIKSCKAALQILAEADPQGEKWLPFGVNVPLMYPQVEEIMKIIVEEGVPIVFTSAGSPKKWTPFLKSHGIIVAHVVSSSLFAVKCEEAGVDAVVAEGFEAGGHNGREETTTFCLIPQVREAITIPLIAAGGVASRASYDAAFALGADGVQIGTRFALCTESSAHPAFKERCRGLKEGETKLLLKKLAPARLVDNEFSRAVQEAENRGASATELEELLGRGRAKKGIFEGDLEEGELEIGQVASMIRKEESVADILNELTLPRVVGLGSK